MAETKAEKDAQKAGEKAEKVAQKADRTSATVTWKGGARTYTREVHGDSFADLAKEFAEKKGGTIA